METLADALPKEQQRVRELRRLHAENAALQQGYDAARLEIGHLRGVTKMVAPSGECPPSAAYAELPIPSGVSDDGYNLFLLTQMRAYADATCAMRAQAAPVAQGDAWRDLCWQIADALECTPCTADEVLPRVLTVAEDAARYRWLAAHCRSTSEHWGGRWSIVVDGLAPKSHDSEDDFDAAIDAARKQGANHDHI